MKNGSYCCTGKSKKASATKNKSPHFLCEGHDKLILNIHFNSSSCVIQRALWFNTPLRISPNVLVRVIKSVVLLSTYCGHLYHQMGH